MSDKSQKIKIVFMGTSSFAATALKALHEAQYNIVAVYTRPDSPAGRKQEITKSAVKIMAEELSLSVAAPEKLDENAISIVRSLAPDIIVVAAYGKILPREILKIPRLGALNVHASILPKFRGPSPIQNTLMLGEKETGITIMLMDEGIDTGQILAQEKTGIEKDETYSQLEERLAIDAAKLLPETIALWSEGKIKSVDQDNAQAIICQLIEKEDGKINWSDEAETIYNQYRAFAHWPGIYTFWEKNGSYLRLKLNKINLILENPAKKYHIGEVFSLDGKIGVQAGMGVIILEEVQMEGKKNVTASEFLRGAPDLQGSILK